MSISVSVNWLQLLLIFTFIYGVFIHSVTMIKDVITLTFVINIILVIRSCMETAMEDQPQRGITNE